MKTKRLNEFVTLVLAILLVPTTTYIANYLRIFEEIETTQSRSAKELIKIFNATKFVSGGPVSWKLINDYKDDRCLDYSGKITWNIMNFSFVLQDYAIFSSRNSHQLYFVTERKLAYNQTHAIIPRHFLKDFWSFNKGDYLYTSWKNFSIPTSYPVDPIKLPPLCARVLNEVRKATQQEITEFAKIYPVKIDIHDGHWEFE